MQSSFPSEGLLYRFEPLQSSRHIRLLRLRSQQANCRLRSHELISVHIDHAPAFLAISYRWDAEKGLGYVSIGNKVLRVTLNCKMAVTYFSKIWPGLLIWIDALCINQSDVKEKNVQVALMRNVYQIAQGTIVWLGEKLPDLDFALNLHAALRSGIFDFNNMETAKREDPNHPFHPRRDKKDEVQNPYQYHADCWNVTETLELVLQRSWFGRVWMIQEVALSRQIFVCCANAFFGWDQLVEAAKSLAAAQGPNRKALFDLPLKIMEARDHYKKHTVTFYEILQLSRSFDASDPRDKIYGLLGLSEDFASAIGPPDYNKPATEVWSKMACIYLDKYSLQGLSMLTSAVDLQNLEEALPEYMDDEHRDEQTPTWLEGLDRVDVRRKSDGYALMDKAPTWVANLNFPALQWPMNNPTDASDEHSQLGEINLQREKEKLHILGAIVSPITIVPYGNSSGNNRQMWWAWDKWMEVAGWLDMTQRPVRHPEHPDVWFKYFTGESMKLVFWKTVFCDENNEIADDDSLAHWHSWFCCELWMNLIMMDSRFLIERDTSEHQLGKRTTSIAMLRNATRHKKVFQAEDAIGIGPTGIQEGDKVVMFHGYKYPFVARPKSSSTRWFAPWRNSKTEYQLIGPCYIHAISDWDKYHEKKLEWEDLTFI